MITRTIVATLLLLCLAGSGKTQSPVPAHPRRSDTTIVVHEGSSLIGVLSPDGGKIALIILGEIFIADRSTGRAVPLIDPSKDPGAYDAVVWSPDSRRVLLQSSYLNPNGLILVDVRTGDRTRITARSDFESLAWTSANTILATVATRDSVELRSYLPQAASSATRIAMLPGNSRFLTATPDGRIAAFASPTSNVSTPVPETQIFAFDVDSHRSRALTAPGTLDDAPAISPDGRSIAFTSERSGSREVWVMDIDGTHAHALTHGAADVLLTPKSWTPDSRNVVYAAQGRLFRVGLDGGSPIEVPFSAPFRVARWTGLQRPQLAEPGARRKAQGITDPALSPDGRSVVFAALGDLWLASVDGGAPQRLTNTPSRDESHPRWSPDGRRIAFQTISAGSDFALHVVSIDAPDRDVSPPVSPFTAASFAWSPDGHRIAFAEFTRVGWIDVATATRHMLAPPGAPVSSLAGWLAADSILFSTAAIVQDTTPAGHAVHTFHTFHAGFAVDSMRRNAHEMPPEVGPLRSSWTADLRHVAYVRGARGYWRDLSAAAPVVIPDPSPRSFTWSADGSFLLYLSNGKVRLLHTTDRSTRTLEIAPEYRVANAPRPMLIRGARIIDGRGSNPSAPRDILIERGRIRRIATAGQLRAPAGTMLVDASSLIVMPGLFDLHAHLIGVPPSPEYLYYGVTSIRDVGTRGEWTLAQRERAESGVFPSPRIFMSAGQLTDSYELGDRGLTAREEADTYDSIGVAAQIASLRANGTDIIKLYFRNNGFDAVASDAAHAAGLPVTGHFITPGAAARGQEGKEHSHLLYGVDGWTAPWRDDVIGLAKAASMCITPTLAVYVPWQTHGRSSLYPADTTLADEPATARFMPPFLREILRSTLRAKVTPRARELWDTRFRDDVASVGRLAKAGVRLGAGTDTGPEGRSLQMELELLVTAGLTPLQAIRAATYDAAKCVGVDTFLGSIESGKIADLVLVEGDPSRRITDASRVKLVVLGGKLITRTQLDSLVTKD